VLELGPVNATIHKVDECVALDELEQLPRLYRAMCERMLESCGKQSVRERLSILPCSPACSPLRETRQALANVRGLRIRFTADDCRK
jgi:hypothetical protein